MARASAKADLLVTQALELFAKQTVSGTSLQMIADRLGITKAAIFYHFPSKDALVRAVVAPAFELLGAVTSRAAQIPESDERRRFLVTSMARHAVDNRDLYSVVLRDVSLGSLIQWDAASEHLYEDLRKLLMDDLGDVGSRAAVGFFLSGLAAPSFDPLLNGMSGDELYDAIVTMGYRLLQVPEPDST